MSLLSWYPNSKMFLACAPHDWARWPRLSRWPYPEIKVLLLWFLIVASVHFLQGIYHRSRSLQSSLRQASLPPWPLYSACKLHWFSLKLAIVIFQLCYAFFFAFHPPALSFVEAKGTHLIAIFSSLPFPPSLFLSLSLLLIGVWGGVDSAVR